MEKERKRYSMPGAVMEGILLSVGIYLLLTAIQAFVVVKGVIKEMPANGTVTVMFGFISAWCGGMWGNTRVQKKKPYIGILCAIGMLLSLMLLGVGIWGGVVMAGEGGGIACGIITGGVISTFFCRKKRKRGKRIKK